MQHPSDVAETGVTTTPMSELGLGTVAELADQIAGAARRLLDRATGVPA